jgi:hypothetical protein
MPASGLRTSLRTRLNVHMVAFVNHIEVASKLPTQCSRKLFHGHAFGGHKVTCIVSLMETIGDTANPSVFFGRALTTRNPDTRDG